MCLEEVPVELNGTVFCNHECHWLVKGPSRIFNFLDEELLSNKIFSISM